jgi:hypothetical protein
MGTNTANYLVFWDITRSGNSFTFTGPAGPYSVTGSAGDKGTDVAVFDMNGDGTRDLVVMNSAGSTGSKNLRYYYGTLSTSGTVSSWTTGSSSGTYLINTDHNVGFSITYPSSKIATVAYRDDSGRMRQHYFHFANSGAIDAEIRYNFGPLKTVGTMTGLGAGDAINLGEQSYNEQFFSWADSRASEEQKSLLDYSGS